MKLNQSFAAAALTTAPEAAIIIGSGVHVRHRERLRAA